MNTTVTMDESERLAMGNPGVELAKVREKKGYTQDYVADKLHLRTRIVELIDLGDFHALPQPVFIKGYIRAYAKLLDLNHDAFLDAFNEQFDFENSIDKALLQHREVHRPHK